MVHRSDNHLLRILFALGFALFIGNIHAAPSIWWDHLEASPATTVPDCVSQAAAVVLPNKNLHVTIDADSVRVWSEKTVGIVECIRWGDGIITAILVTGEDPEEGTHLFHKIRSGMKQPPSVKSER